MLANQLKTALRALRRRRSYATLNIAGLAIGLACVLLIALWLKHETSYDAFHEKAERIYRVVLHGEIPDGAYTIASAPGPLAPAVEQQFPDVEEAVRADEVGERTIRKDGRSVLEEQYMLADPGFFETFSFEMLRGAPGEVLAEPGSLVLTESAAERYFPETPDPVGQTLEVDGETKRVAGVVANPPAQSSITFDFVETTVGTSVASGEGWGRNNITAYVVLREGASASALEAQMSRIIGERKEASERAGYSYSMFLQPLTAVHFGQGVPYEIASAGNPTYVWVFAALALFVLLIAGLNFVNLSTARSSERAKEVGVRRAVGAARGGLVVQFLVESLLLTFAAALVALAIARAALPFFGGVVGTELSLALLFTPLTTSAALGGVVAVGLGAGLYPAFALSRFSPVEALRGSASSGRRAGRLRRGLVVFQFALSVALIAGTFVAAGQLRYLRGKSLGFEQSRVVVVENVTKVLQQAARDASAGGRRAMFAAVGERMQTLRQELERLPGVKQASATYATPGQGFIKSVYWPVVEGRSRIEGEEAGQQLQYTFGDVNYTEMLGLEMVAGRGFSEERGDSLAVVLNESAAQTLFGQENPVGQRIARGVGDDGTIEYEVVGVAENFHFQSLREEIRPMALFYNQGWQRTQQMAVRIDPSSTGRTLAQIEETWNEIASGVPFTYSFLDDTIEAQYRYEERVAKIFAGFAVMAVLVACLGLFGLAAYAAERRIKEIAVRKALGASVPSVVGLLSKDFAWLVAVGFALAVPVVYLGASRWLGTFAYHDTLGVGAFLFAGVLAFVVAGIAVSYHALRAARANPAQALRDK